MKERRSASRGTAVRAPQEQFVTESLVAAEELEELMSRPGQLDLLIDQLPVVAWTTDNVLRVTWIRGRAMPRVLRNGDDLPGQSIRELVRSEAGVEDFIAIHRDALNGHDSTFEHEWYDRWYLSHVAPLRRADGAIIGTIGLAQNVTQRKDLENRATYQSQHDHLTGLPNRLLFQDRLAAAMIHAVDRNEPLTLVTFDLDEFKRVNDTYGHSVGDVVLWEIAERLAESFRDEDIIAKIGGDQFAILIPNSHGTEEEASNISERLLALVRQPVIIGDGDPLFMSTSIGIAIFDGDDSPPEDLLQNAEAAMYGSKEAGRNTFRIASEEASESSRSRMEIETGLYKALGAGELELFYQPVVHMRDRSISGYEALIRWNHPTRGLMGAGEFMEIAEQSPVMTEIGDWVLREAILQAAEWRRSRPDVRIAINVSAHQFHQRDLPQMVLDLCNSCDVDPAALEIEITESAALLEVERAAITIARLREIGTSVAIDDFGTGFSSLVYLKRFPVAAVKIDQGFVRDMASERRDVAIVNAILAAARALDLRVVAEGIETEEQAALLLEGGCHEGQGFLFGRPKPVRELD